MDELNLVKKSYQIGQGNFVLQTDFTFKELDWLDCVLKKLQGNKNAVTGSFTREEIKKTMTILLPGLTDEDFDNMRESQVVKIIADFFLTRALLGAFMTDSLKN